MSQNSQSKSVNLTLPTLQATMERIYPFAPKVGAKKGFFRILISNILDVEKIELLQQKKLYFRLRCLTMLKLG